MPSLETVCTECGRTVGVVQSISWKGEYSHLKVALHAATPDIGDGAHRPRCIGTGFVPHPLNVFEVRRSAEDRKREERIAARVPGVHRRRRPA